MRSGLILILRVVMALGQGWIWVPVGVGGGPGASPEAASASVARQSAKSGRPRGGVAGKAEGSGDARSVSVGSGASK